MQGLPPQSSSCSGQSSGPGDLRNKLLALTWLQKRSLQVVVDVVLVCAALLLAFWVRLESLDQVHPLGGHLLLFVGLPMISVPIFVVFGLYRAVVRYVGIHALWAICKAVALSSALLALVVAVHPESIPGILPRSLPVLYAAFSLFLIGGVRLVMRAYLSSHINPVSDAWRRVELPRVAIYGAGSAGNQLMRALRIGREMLPVAFIDDDPQIHGRIIDGIRVYGSHDIACMVQETCAREVLLAVPSASKARRREMLEELERFHLHVRIVPGFMDLASGRVKVNDFQDVDIADLLGRDVVAPQTDLFERCICGQAVLVTGAGGSIGSELCRQILNSEPRVLILYEHSEYALYSIHSELVQRLQAEGRPLELIPILGSVGNFGRMRDVMQTWKVDTVYHAAAYKHVPMVEFNVAEGFFNNTMGTLHAVQAAIVTKVSNFVLVSTDKAVRPTNVMGSTKRMAELVLQALAREREPALFRDLDGERHVNATRFTMVRFGNVLGSSGSVVPVFREQIKRGGPVTVTHPEITRYFMTIPEAAQLVIQAGSMGQGGDVFVLDMGKPVKIVDLAEKKIRLAGLTVRNADNPAGDIEIVFTGLRPGEKLYEELLIGGDVLETAHPMIMRSEEELLAWEELKALFGQIINAIRADDYPQVRILLQQIVTGYQPEAKIVDLMYAEQTRH